MKPENLASPDLEIDEIHAQLVATPSDEPPVYLAAASSEFNGTWYTGSAADLEPDRACVRAKWECAERLSTGVAANRVLNEIQIRPASHTAADAVPLDAFVSARRVSPTDNLGWLPCTSLVTGEKRLVPSQVLGFAVHHDETAIVQDPTTSGTAIHTEQSSARLAAVHELVERDAFMRAYFGLSVPQKVGHTSPLSDLYERYRLEPHLYQLHGAADLVVFLCVLCDRSGVGPAVTSGLGVSANREGAIERAMLEAWQPRAWLRAHRPEPDTQIDPTRIRTPIDRGRYWYSVSRLRNLETLLAQRSTNSSPVGGEDAQRSSTLAETIDKLASMGHDLWEFNVGSDVGYYSTRVAGPDMYTLFLDESNSYEAKKPKVADGFPTPHFFL